MAPYLALELRPETYVDVYVDVGTVQDLDLASDDLGHEEQGSRADRRGPKTK